MSTARQYPYPQPPPIPQETMLKINVPADVPSQYVEPSKMKQCQDPETLQHHVVVKGENTRSVKETLTVTSLVLLVVLMTLLVGFVGYMVTHPSSIETVISSHGPMTSSYYGPPNSPLQPNNMVASHSDVPNLPYGHSKFDFNLQRPQDSRTRFGSAQPATSENWNSLGGQSISQTLFTLEINGANSPHHHPDGVEVLFVFEGTIEVTRIEPNDGHRVYVDRMEPGMSVVFPRGHVHMQRNIGQSRARYISTLNSERPGVYSLAQRTCQLSHDALRSAFSHVTLQAIDELCANVPDNIIEFFSTVPSSPSLANRTV